MRECFFLMCSNIARNLVRLCHIGGEEITLDFLRDLLRILFVARMHDYFSAFTGERARNGQADVMCRTGYQRRFYL